MKLSSKILVHGAIGVAKYYMPFIVGMVLFFLLSAPIHSEFIKFRQALKIYPSAAEGANTEVSLPELIEKLKKGDIARFEDFMVKAKVSLITEKKPLVYSMQWLHPVFPGSPETTPSSRRFPPLKSAQQAGDEWKLRGNSFAWGPGSKVQNTTVSFDAFGDVVMAGTGHVSLAAEGGAAYAETLSGIPLSDFDELWIEYKDIFPERPCPLSVHMGLESKDYGTGVSLRFSAVADHKVLRPVSEINPAEALWEKKDRAYSLGRVMRSKPDEKWRYSFVDEKTVLQRRLHAGLTGIEAMDFVFAPGTIVEGLIIRIATEDNYSAGETVELEKNQEMFTDSSGQPVWRVSVPITLRKHFTGEKKAFLQELIVLIKGDVSVSAGIRPLRKVVFQALTAATEGNPVAATESNGKTDESLPKRALSEILPYKVESVSLSTKRMVVYLHSLRKKGAVVLKHGNLVVPRSTNANLSGVKIENMRLVKLYDKDSPVFIGAGEELDKRWGGPFAASPFPEKQTEWPMVSAYFPFEVLRLSPELGKDSTSGFVFKSAGKTEYGDVEANPAGRKHRLIAERGVSFRSELPFTRAVSEGEGLVLEGPGKSLEIELPFSGVLDNSSLFFMGVPEGADQIRKMALTCVFESGSDLRLVVKPNRPEPIHGSGKLKGLRLTIDLANAPYRLKLKDVVLFRPRLLTKEEAFTKKIPVEITEKPVPSGFSGPGGAIVNVTRGNLRGMVSIPDPHRRSVVVPRKIAQTVFRWSTVPASPMEWAKGIRLSYNAPAGAHAGNPCWLNLKLNWERQSISRDICPGRAEGDIFLPISGFLINHGGETGALKSADWTANLDGGPAAPDRSFEFEASFEGLSMKSAADELRNWPVLLSSGLPLGFVSEPETVKEILKRRIWLTAAAGAVSKIAVSGGSLEAAESPWFGVNSAFIVPCKGLSDGVWDKLVEKDEPASDGPNIFRFLKPIFLIVSAFLLWKGFKSARGSDILEILKNKISSVVSRVKIIADKHMPRKLKSAQLWFREDKIRALTIFWFTSTLCLYAAGLLRYAVGRLHITGLFDLAGFFGYAARVLNLTGFLGQAGLPHMTEIVQPIIAPLHYMVTLLQYILGPLLLFSWGEGENYYFTFGGMAAAIFMRYALSMKEPFLKKRVPSISVHIFAGGGSPYFTCATIAFALAIGIMALGARPVAEQFAIIAFYSLCIGAVKEIFAQRKAQ